MRHPAKQRPDIARVAGLTGWPGTMPMQGSPGGVARYVELQMREPGQATNNQQAIVSHYPVRLRCPLLFMQLLCCTPVSLTLFEGVVHISCLVHKLVERQTTPSCCMKQTIALRCARIRILPICVETEKEKVIITDISTPPMTMRIIHLRGVQYKVKLTQLLAHQFLVHDLVQSAEEECRSHVEVLFAIRSRI